MTSRHRLQRVLSRATVETLETRRLLSASAPKALTNPVVVKADDSALPRNLTPAEIEYLKTHQLGGDGTRVPSTPPSGPIKPIAEYEPMEGLVISWMTYTSTLAQISKRVTDAGGRMYIGVTSSGVQSSATTTLNSLSVNMSLVTFFTVALDSVWARDYGPRYVYEGNVRVITDHEYNRPRPNDNNEPIVFSSFKKQQIYQIGLNGTSLIHGGGNFHLEDDGDAYATTLTTDENPSFTASQVQQIWKTYENDNVTLTGRFPVNVDSTGHIDMWMYIYGNKKVFISDWPSNSGSAQDVICDNTAALMQSRGYQVTRLPAYSIGGTHYTYANMVVFNNIVLLPQYNNGPGAAVSTQAFNTVQAAVAPLGMTVFQINADQMITAAGAFHCIVQHVPVEKGLPGANGGLAPVAYLRGPNNAEAFQAGNQYTLQWITDDDAPISATAGVQSVDLLLSTDGGQTFPTTIASNQPALGSFNWTVPAGVNTAGARIRVVAHDALGNTGFDDSDRNFIIGQPATTLAPSRPSLNASSDSGNNADGITRYNNSSNAAQLIFDVPGTIAGATVSVYADGTFIGSAIATGANTSVTTDGGSAGALTLSDGAHNITARQLEPGKFESSDSTLLSITIDATAPIIANPGDQGFEIVSTAGTIVNFLPATASDNLDAAPVVSYDRAPGSSFLPDNTTVNATATDVAGNSSDAHFVITLNDPAFMVRSAGAAYAFSGPPAAPTLTISAGMVTFIADADAPRPNLQVNVTGAGSALTLSAAQHLAGIALDQDTSATLAANGNNLLVVKSLTLDPLARLDLYDNDLLFDYDGSTPLPDVQALINSARAGNAWTGNGITSATAGDNVKHNTTLGAMEAADYKSISALNTRFDGEPIDNTAVLIKYTYYGDANFNGKVDGADYGRIDSTFNQEHSAGNIGGWNNGDFNGDGKVDGADYGLIDGAFNSQASAL